VCVSVSAYYTITVNALGESAGACVRAGYQKRMAVKAVRGRAVCSGTEHGIQDGCRRPERSGARTRRAGRCGAPDAVDVPRRHLARTCSLVAGTEWLRCFGISPITTAAAGDVFGFSDDCRVPRPPPLVNQLCGHVPARGNEFDVRRDPTHSRQHCSWCHCGTLHKRIPLFGHDVPKNHRSLTSYHVVLADAVHHRCINYNYNTTW